MLSFSTLDSIEYSLVKIVQEFDGTFLDTFSEYVSNIPIMLAVFGIIIILMIWKKHKLWRPLLFALIVSIVVSYTVNEWIFKILFSEINIFRPRPWMIHPDLLAIGHAFQDSSFPSSHMAFTTLLVMIVSYFEKRFIPYGVIIIIIMWLSRIHNGMHYPTDVLIGTFMWILYALFWLFLMKRFWLEKRPWWKRWFKSF